ncbi:hypothetical protein SprV_0401735100 [Sparganum proliferum]
MRGPQLNEELLRIKHGSLRSHSQSNRTAAQFRRDNPTDSAAVNPWMPCLSLRDDGCHLPYPATGQNTPDASSVTTFVIPTPTTSDVDSAPLRSRTHLTHRPGWSFMNPSHRDHRTIARNSGILSPHRRSVHAHPLTLFGQMLICGEEFIARLARSSTIPSLELLTPHSPVRPSLAASPP